MKTLMAQHRSSARATETARGGFTLVEMMVATTLVVMMMLMFAQIYVAAIDSLGEQQAVARNDGKARLVDTILQGDLDRISYLSTPNSNQGIVPLVMGDVVQSWQRGFVYISENDQTNPNDDVLHFTSSIKTSRSRDQSLYYGRARNVTGTLVYGTGASPQFPNHPEIDDGDTGNDVGASRDAEICYFVRGGNLYRRVLLIRDIDLAGVPGTNAAQPSQGTVDFNATITPANGPTTPSYYKAFDYSAYCRIPVLGDTTLDSVRFLGTDALQNHSVSPAAGTFTLSTESLGCSMTRFGFAITAGNQTNTNGDPTLRSIIRARGTPREYDSLGNFFGRPLHAETGSYQWQWPGTRINPLWNPDLRCYPVPPTTSTRSNELSLLNVPLTDADGSAANYTRATEDLLLSNVEAFDIEVWDQGLFEDFDQDGAYDAGVGDLNGNGFPDQASGFVQLGNGATTGYFRSDMRQNTGYGPGGPSGNWVFDTGHPDMWTETGRSLSTPFSSYGAAQRPPYRPLQYRVVERDIDADGNADPNEDIDGDGVLDLALPFTNPVRAASLWYPGVTYTSGDVVFRPLDTARDLDTADVTTSGVVHPPLDSTYSIAYRCVGSGEDANGDQVVSASENNGTAGTQYGSSGTTAPAWPTVPGQRVTEGNAGSTVTWEAFDNRVGLQKIRITIRVRDPKEDLPRQFSIIHSFANPTKSN